MSSDASCQREHPRPAARGYSASRRDVPERRFGRAPCGERASAQDSANGPRRSRRPLPVQAHRDPAWQHPLDLRWVAAESAPPTAHRCS
ncbi:hypothetical protein EYE35_11850 [Cereibacter sphaeroides]|nr:hypothetical protein EYE35_11850 [Cereibacter sphaeroides]